MWVCLWYYEQTMTMQNLELIHSIFQCKKLNFSHFFSHFFKLFKARYIHSFVSVFSSFIYILASMSFTFLLLLLLQLKHNTYRLSCIPWHKECYSEKRKKFLLSVQHLFGYLCSFNLFQPQSFSFYTNKGTTFLNDVHFISKYKVRSR